MGVVEIIGKQGRAFQVSLGLILLVLVGTGGLFATSSLLEFSVFFIIPVAYFTWFIHRKAGTLASVVSAVVTLWANIGSPLHVGHPAVAYWNALIWLGFFISITFIVAALKFLHDRERQLSRLDSLTGIANRLGFYEYANGERKRAGRSKQPITLAYLDLDGFKEINDTLGHQTGDKVLVSVARTMQMSVRQTDMVGRMGGDEFALILPDASKAAANMVLQKVSRMLERGMKQNGWRITFSIGAVTFLAPPVSVQEMIAGADQVMFAVKNSGKNRLQHEVQDSCSRNAVTPVDSTSHSEISLCYNARLRTHLDLEKDAPIPPSVQPPSIGRVIEMPQGGGGARLCLVAVRAASEVEWTIPPDKITQSSSKRLMR